MFGLMIIVPVVLKYNNMIYILLLLIIFAIFWLSYCINTGNKYKVAYLNKILQELKDLNLKKNLKNNINKLI